MNRRRVAVLGAGPAGLSAARYLSDHEHIDVTVFEQSENVGGLHQSFEVQGQEGREFDVGTILFNEKHGLLAAFPHLAEQMIAVRYAPRAINPQYSIDRYPFSIGRFVKDNGVFRTGIAVADLLFSKLRYRSRQSVPDYCKYYMGGTVYKRSGLQNYIKRLHNVDDIELDVEFAIRRLPQIRNNSLRNLIVSKLPGRQLPIKPVSGLRLVRSVEGFGSMYETIREVLEAKGVSILNGQKLESLVRVDDTFELTSNEKKYQFDDVISTIPIPDAMALIGEVPSSAVETRNLVSLFYVGNIAKPGNTFFNFTYDASWKRITVFSRFYETGSDAREDDYFTVEITVDDDVQEDDISVIADDFEKHIERTGLTLKKPELVGHYLTVDAYPVYRNSQSETVAHEKAVLKEFGIELLGRQGNFEYEISNIVAKQALFLTEKMLAENE
ncbi:protoporphyrinogen/coproporphyrinogen oxidase [Granulosicoccus sp. 3-233]|uniref:protoporphyrinogen/coproporphyrinogen oxidase n=1 Tax=Granulosicoccus sp. 3-233 TaxID=3417969 RepID=UPI003D32D896